MTDFPDLPIASATFKLISNVQVFKSSLSGNNQIKELPGSHWSVVMAFKSLTTSEHITLFSFLNFLNGGVNSALIKPVGYTKQGSLSSNPLVKGASQTGSLLIVDGLPLSTTNLLKAGDYFEVNGEFNQVRYGTSLDSDATGTGTITLTRPLRKSPSDNATVEVLNPKLTAIPVSRESVMQVTQGNLGNTTIEMIEVF